MTVPQSVTIPKGESKSVDMSVAIPKGHGAGSYYSAIVYSSGSGTPGSGGNLGLSASGVTLVFTQIPGKVNEDLRLKHLGSYRPAAPGNPGGYTLFNTSEPQNIGYTLENKGNVTEAPVGSITLKGWFGSPITINNVNPSSSLALIGQTRTYTACIKLKESQVDFNGATTKAVQCDSPGLWPGLYTVSIDLYYGQNGNNTQEITGSALMWYLPWWFILLSIVVITLVGFFGWRAVRWVREKLGIQSSRKSRRR